MNKNFTTIEATYRIVTPMFCSGGDPTKAELRLASFKGALRFWWRSLMWGKVDGVADLHKREAALFGSSEQKVGQSKVRMRITSENLLSQVNTGEVWEKGRLKGTHYLGYGVMEAFSSSKTGKKAGQLTRPMIPGGIFTVQLRLSPLLNEEQKQQVQNALIMLGTVGGLGSKSRKGFGSLTLTELTVDGETRELATSPAKRIKELTSSLKDGQPQWTAWSKQSRVLLVKSEKASVVELLDQLGREQVYYRSWGNRGKVIDREREENFKEDHDLSKKDHDLIKEMKVSIKHPRRIAFGLPHNYGKGDSKAVAPASRDLERRASPLFLHIHQIDEQDSPVGVAVFLPSQFLPENEKIRAFGNSVPLDSSEEFWNPINGYLDRLTGKSGATKKVQNSLRTEEVSLG